MTETAVYLQPAFILQHRKFRETSLILDVLTRDYGRVSLLARGVRKSRSKTAGLLQPFIPLAISYLGRMELKIMTNVEIIPPYHQLQGAALYSGFYINELIGFFLHKDDPHPEIFNHYRECVIDLADSSKTEAALRNFEIDLVHHAGYGLQLNYDLQHNQPLDSLKTYKFDIEQGPIEAEDGKFSGAGLQAISSREFSDPQVLVEAKRLMRTVIDSYLQGKQLKTRLIMSKIIKHTKNA
ncbi:MAG: DNA repair protein RecO [Methylococcaceae bacterium]|nr:DNA repair protein RecO [Methylococcaceae bacterium]